MTTINETQYAVQDRTIVLNGFELKICGECDSECQWGLCPECDEDKYLEQEAIENDYQDDCNTCGCKVEDGLAGWCGECRYKDECLCEVCEEVKVGCEMGCDFAGGYKNDKTVYCPECFKDEYTI